MSVQVKGSGTIGGLDEGLVISGIVTSSTQINVGSNIKFGSAGIATASNFKTGSSNLHSTGLTVGNNFLHTTGINVGTGATIHVPATNVLTLGTNSNERVRIESGGDVDIKNGVIKLASGSNRRLMYRSGDNDIILEGANNFFYQQKIADTSHRWYTNGADTKFMISAAGKVSIGTTTPSSNSAAYMLTIADPTNSSGNCGITLRSGTGGGSNTNEGSIFFSDATSGAGEYAGYLQYSHKNDRFRIGVATTERFCIKSNGYVGVNETDPQYPLHVAGATTVSAPTGTGILMGLQHEYALIHLNAADDKGAIIDFSVPGQDRRGGILYYFNNNPTASSRDSMQFYTNGQNERLRITSDGRLSINDSSPNSNETLTIQPVGNIACDVAMKMNTSTDARIKFYDSGGTWRGGFGFTEYANSSDYPNFHDSFYMQTDPGSNGSLEVVQRVNNNGCFIYPKQPCFSVTMGSDYSSSSDHTANFNTIRFDQGNNYSTGSNGIFTAPVTGKYYMHAAIQTRAGGTASQVHIMGVSFWVNGSVQVSKGSGDQYLGRDTAHYITVHCIRILNLAQGDTVQVRIQLHGTVEIEGSGGSDRCNWQGYLMA